MEIDELMTNIKMPKIDKLFRKLIKISKKLNKFYFLIIFLSLVNCKEKISADDNQDYSIYNNVASIISSNQQHQIYNQTDFKPSNWHGKEDRLGKLKRLESVDKYRKYMQLDKLRSKSDDDNYYLNSYQFKRRSDFDEDYYSPPYSPSYHHHLVYPPAVQPIISLPTTVLATPSPTYPHNYYRKYIPSASRNYYQRAYPSTSNAIRRRLAAASSSNYETTSPYYLNSPSPHSSYYYGNGLISHPGPSPYAATYPNHYAYGISGHAAEHDAHHDTHHEKTEIHSILPIITVIGISALLIPLLTTFFSAMISSGTATCCQATRQKERNDNLLDLKNSLYEKNKDTWPQVQKAINQW